LAAAHLVVVVCGAAQRLPNRSQTPPARLLQWYATMSGAGSQYGFYAPEVGNECRARFLVQDDQGTEEWDDFEQTRNPEARLRLGLTVLHAFANGEAAQDAERRQRLVKSWAAAMFTRHPRAVSVTVVVETYDVPPMSGYRTGLRPNWNVVYQAQVQRNSPAPEEAEP
jgi:hypothetical protein